MTGLEPIFLEAAKSLASLAVRVISDGGGGALSWLGKGLNEQGNQLLFDASQQYIQNYRDRHGLIKVLGMRQPIALESIYTTVQFFDESNINRFASAKSLEENYKFTNIRSFQSKDLLRKDGMDSANQHQFLMVLGSPGGGKSTFLKKIGLEALKGKQGLYKHRRIPVLIELKKISSNELIIEKLISEEFRICGFPSPESFTRKALKQGRLLILLDGLDEVPKANLDFVVDRIQSFVDCCSIVKDNKIRVKLKASSESGNDYHNEDRNSNRFIISCRIAAYRNDFRRFTDVTMAEFSENQIKQFIFNFFISSEDQQVKTAEKCWDLLKKPENLAAKELAHTPLLLTFLCLIYDHSQNFPDNRSVLYRKSLRILLEEWASEKRILRESIYEGLNTELEEIFLSEFAYSSLEIDKLFFDREEITEKIKKFLTVNLNAPKHLNSEAVLEAITVQQGIFVERAEDVFSFSHLTLQEYLVAQYIVDNGLVSKLTQDYVISARWHEVFLLVAGLLRGGADELLLRMESVAYTFINTSRLLEIQRWVSIYSIKIQVEPTNLCVRCSLVFSLLISLLTLLRNSLSTIGGYNSDQEEAIENIMVSILENLINIHELIGSSSEFPVSIRNHSQFFELSSMISPSEVETATLKASNNFVKDFSKIYRSEKLNGLTARLEALKLQIPYEKASISDHKKFIQRIAHTWFNFLDLNPDAINITYDESKALNNYFHTILLILRCKNSAVKVSRETWNNIEARIFNGNVKNNN